MGRKFGFLLISLFLISCDPTIEVEKRKYEYSEVLDKHINYDEVFLMPQDEYYLYYYQISCYHCHGIKSKVIYFALTSSIPVYFIEITEDKGFKATTKEETIGTNDYLSAFSKMTPQLSLVRNGYISETYLGQEEILNVVES